MDYTIISPQEWERLNLRHKPTIKLTERYRVYCVSSQTHQGSFYVVDATKKRCSCPAGSWGKNCWHKSLVLAYDDWRMRCSNPSK